ncbi:MAG: hypothetical protein IJL92_00395 [Thermoguttaceae bacterium]|nr:hypothetical protein [Thermoguttaceae bacterium]
MSSNKTLSRRAFVKVARSALRARRDPRLKGKRRHAIALYALVLSRSLPERFARHFATVVIHKTYVFLYCAYAGRPFRGFMHDWSKFSPSEFLSSVKYYSGRNSPVGLEREIEGRSFAWLHHKGRNKHHFEYWQDVVDENGRFCTIPNAIYPLPMPFPFALEMICDVIAASRAYNGKRFHYDLLMKWWNNHCRRPVNMHPRTRRFAQEMYEQMQRDGNCSALRRAREIYDRAQIDPDPEKD